MAEAALEEEDDSGPVSNSLNFFLSSMTVKQISLSVCPFQAFTA
jgi:hypothetical protein